MKASYAPLLLSPFLLLLLLLLLPACQAADAIAQAPGNNPDVKVELLFSRDGCDIYRFWDRIPHYYVRCLDPAKAQATISSISCGKNCRTDEMIQTSTR